MHPTRSSWVTVAGEKPAALHRMSNLSGRTCCGKRAELRPATASNPVVCRRCIALDTARRAGLPDWY